MDFTCVLSAVAAATNVSQSVHEMCLTESFKMPLNGLDDTIAKTLELTAELIENESERACKYQNSGILDTSGWNYNRHEHIRLHIFHYAMVLWLKAWNDLISALDPLA